MNRFKPSLVFVALLSLSNSYAESDVKSVKLNYIEQYRTTAIQQMIHTKIPASITLAQGLLESGAGTSRLATLGNNHFGIKCHNWTGERMFHDDDAKGECFRVYENAEHSFVDHSEFLMTRDRYAFLFGLGTTDYEGWAKGLKKAGYATNPQYAQLLIKLIEDYNLDDFDAAILPPKKNKGLFNSRKDKFSLSNEKETTVQREAFVVAEKGDTYYQISQEFSTALWELHKYNDFSDTKDVLEPGDKVYLEPKKNKIKMDESVVITQRNQSLRALSQDLGIKLKKLEKRNPGYAADDVLPKGAEIVVR